MKYLWLTATLLFCQQLYSEDIHFIQNNGQWSDKTLYKAFIPSGELYLEKGKITYSFFDTDYLHHLHHLEIEDPNFNKAEHHINAYAYQVEFINHNQTINTSADNPISTYHNYFLGNDSEKWKGKVPLFEQVRQENIFENIDLLLYSQEVNFKYDFIVKPNANTEDIQLKYHGIVPTIKNGNVILDIGFNTLVEQKPYAYQIINGKKHEVDCEYILKDNVLSFHFPKEYNRDLELIIDPILVVATYSGSTQTGYGHSATYDNLGNIYTAGIFFGTGYPVSTGAFQIPYGGGGQDMGISKLNPDGSNLIWATYIGGNSSDSPQSLVVNNAEELYVFGISSSADYPIATNAFQSSMEGFSDHVITHLTSDGSNILGSTYIGGTADETLIGEIIVDDIGNCYVASGTNSTDYPTSASAFQTTWGGPGAGWGGTGIAFKMPPNLSSVTWSTYLNSETTAQARGINLGADGSVYVTGATAEGFSTIANSANPTNLGGEDAFICQLNETGSTLLASTYYGTTGWDQAYFVDVDVLGDVYITGTTDTEIPITDGCYGTPNSGVFITKLSPSLSTIIWETTIGDGTGWANFTPNAFMVDVCRKIYVGGFGVGGSELFTTSDAFFDGSDWSEGYYMISLEPNASSVFFASYFQGDHVDGGTSRFDPNGIVYQAVCSPNSITPTANAHSTCLTGSYDVAVFKVDFEPISVNALAVAGPSTSGCTPFTVDFTNNSSAESFEWDFDDGAAYSTESNPSHTFNEPGNYQVMLIAIDSNSCNIRDTFYIPISVSNPEVEFDFSFNNACEDSLIQFQSIGTTSTDLFAWNFGDGTTSNLMNPSHTYTNSGTYNVTLDVTSFCGAVDDITYPVQVTPPPQLELGDDIILCNGETLTLDATTPGCSYLWQNNSTDPTFEVTTSGTYSVEVSSLNCSVSDEVSVEVDVFSVDAGEDILFCEESFSTTLTASGGATSYLWSTGETSQSINVNSAGTYEIQATSNNNCVYTDLVTIELYNLPNVNLSSSTQEACAPAYISFSDLTTLVDDEIIEWQWYFEGLESSQEKHPFTYWENDGSFDVGLYVVTNQGCSDSILLNDYITINPSPIASFSTDPLTIDWCNPLLQFINHSTNYDRLIWDFGDGNNSEITNPYHLYNEVSSKHISLYVENDFGCNDSTAYTIFPNNEISVYVPNAFTPEKDGVNEDFKAYSSCLKEFEMWIYSRWGELVFYTNSLEDGWDGTFMNKECQTGVYTWKIKYHGGKANQVQTGSVTLLR